MKDATKMLKQARIDLANGWTQGCYARDQEDRWVKVTDPSACKWCLSGALNLAYARAPIEDMELRYRTFESATGTIAWLLQSEPVVDWNDKIGRTQEEVLELVDQAIAIHEQEESA